MKAILTLDNDDKMVMDIIRMPNKPLFVEQIERELMNYMNAHLVDNKVVKVHLLRN